MSFESSTFASLVSCSNAIAEGSMRSVSKWPAASTNTWPQLFLELLKCFWYFSMSLALVALSIPIQRVTHLYSTSALFNRSKIAG